MMPSLDELRQRLEHERTRLKSEITAVAERPAEYRPTRESYYGNHLADIGTDTFEEEKAVALEAHLTGLLAQVQEALDRFDRGTYGICQECGRPIAPERLEALPYAVTCVKCALPARRVRAAGRA
jgi:RNA polymerase-binding transcription factor DksA